MNKEQIESAAVDYVGLTDDSKVPTRERGARCFAFKDGARWVLDRLCQLPFDEALIELARYAAERIHAQPGAAYLAARMMRDSLAEPADTPTPPDSGELGGKGGAR